MLINRRNNDGLTRKVRNPLKQVQAGAVYHLNIQQYNIELKAVDLRQADHYRISFWNRCYIAATIVKQKL